MLLYQHAPVPLIDTQTGAIEVGHTVRRRSSRIILLNRSLPVWGIVLALYLLVIALVVGQAPVLMRNRASQSAEPALCLPANWGHMDW